MSKITSEHLGRRAYVYVRQSTADQLLHNHESRRRQYGVADRARTLGWSAVEVIDDDLGRSGGGITRPGFERLIVASRRGQAGSNGNSGCVTPLVMVTGGGAVTVTPSLARWRLR